MNGLDLFSGIGGISYGLRDYVRPIAYCEIDRYCQAVLLSRMATKELANGPIWEDIRSLPTCIFEGDIEIIYGGFPCQDISVAGHGKGLEGERSGLFFEIVRLAKEIKPRFIFLENVPAITSRGGLCIVREIASLGYDCRWCIISAASVGAPHLRERWFFLAHASSMRCEKGSCQRMDTEWQASEHEKPSDICSTVANSQGKIRIRLSIREKEERSIIRESMYSSYWQETEPPFCGVDDGISQRVDKLRALGNAVVPQQVKKAFEILMGIKK